MFGSLKISMIVSAATTLANQTTTRSSIDFASHGEILKARRSNGTGAVLENGGGRDELDRLHVTVVGRQY